MRSKLLAEIKLILLCVSALNSFAVGMVISDWLSIHLIARPILPRKAQNFPRDGNSNNGLLSAPALVVFVLIINLKLASSALSSSAGRLCCCARLTGKDGVSDSLGASLGSACDAGCGSDAAQAPVAGQMTTSN